MGGLRCVDGSSLLVIPVASHDRGGRPYEVTLELRRNGESFGRVGERCGFALADLARRLATARAEDSPQARIWADPDDRFPDPAAPYPERTPREPELFAFRYRDRGDVVSTGELRCALRTSSLWVTTEAWSEHHGSWRVARRAVLEAWGSGGHGVRAVLTSAELIRFLTDLLDEAEHVGACYEDLRTGAENRRSRR